MNDIHFSLMNDLTFFKKNIRYILVKTDRIKFNIYTTEHSSDWQSLDRPSGNCKIAPQMTFTL